MNISKKSSNVVLYGKISKEFIPRKITDQSNQNENNEWKPINNGQWSMHNAHLCESMLYDLVSFQTPKKCIIHCQMHPKNISNARAPKHFLFVAGSALFYCNKHFKVMLMTWFIHLVDMLYSLLFLQCLKDLRLLRHTETNSRCSVRFAFCLSACI